MLIACVCVNIVMLTIIVLVMLHNVKTCCEVSLTFSTFETVEEADRAKEKLNGADIYSGCCTLKVDWGKVCCHFVNNCSDKTLT